MMPVLEYNSIVFGVVIEGKSVDLLVNVLLILAKCFIYRAKSLKTLPILSATIMKSNCI